MDNVEKDALNDLLIKHANDRRNATHTATITEGTLHFGTSLGNRPWEAIRPLFRALGITQSRDLHLVLRADPAVVQATPELTAGHTKPIELQGFLAHESEIVPSFGTRFQFHGCSRARIDGLLPADRTDAVVPVFALVVAQASIFFVELRA